MIDVHDLTTLDWTLSGWRQNDWELARTVERAKVSVPDVGPHPVRVPGSVRGALLTAGEIPDPYIGRNSRASEWIENRHWSFVTTIPEHAIPAEGQRAILVCDGLDYAGTVMLGTLEVGSFDNTFLAHEFDLTDALAAGERTLSIVFTDLPDGLGQNGWSSRIRAWKPRFNYGWDWIPRLVQVGITEGVRLELRDDARISELLVSTDLDDRSGILNLAATVEGETAGLTIDVTVSGPGVSLSRSMPYGDAAGIQIAIEDVQPWCLVPRSAQSLYTVTVSAVRGGTVVHTVDRVVGFRNVTWTRSEASPKDAAPWLCVVNGQPTFLQGVNWVPLRADYADVTDEDYLARLTTYRDLGVNTIRVWGGAGLEREVFYRLCDEFGILVWQELPLSSSGLDNSPPTDTEFADELATIAASYVARRGHHPCLILWGGGNELTEVSAPAVPGAPLDVSHPALAAAERIFAQLDPSRRFVATSPTGPRFEASRDEFGLGVHHDVHGPWEHKGSLESWRAYWDADDAILRSEVGVAGASGTALLAEYDLLGDETQIAELRSLWTHSSGWWLAEFDDWGGRTSLDAWIERSQSRQAEMLAYAAAATKGRFPRSTGFIVWMGHDAFPCAVSLSILDFDGTPKPAALALAEVFLSDTELIQHLGEALNA